jgi:hypothetical protein
MILGMNLVSVDFLTITPGSTGPIFWWLIGGDWRKVRFNEYMTKIAFSFCPFNSTLSSLSLLHTLLTLQTGENERVCVLIITLHCKNDIHNLEQRIGTAVHCHIEVITFFVIYLFVNISGQV